MVQNGNTALNPTVLSQESPLLCLKLVVYLWVSRAPPDIGMSLPNLTTAQLLLHMSRNGTSGVQGSLRLECELLRSSDVSGIR